MARTQLEELLDDVPATRALRDMIEPTEYMFGDDFNAPLGHDDEEIAWEGELVDGYPVREKSMEEIRNLRKKAQRMATFEARVQHELRQVAPAPQAVQLYVARIRTACRVGMTSDEFHGIYYEGRRPAGLEQLAEMGFAREAQFAASKGPTSSIESRFLPSRDARGPILIEGGFDYIKLAAAATPESIAAALSPSQRSELAALANGRWSGDPDEVSGLRQLGLQDNRLGLTPLGMQVLEISQRPWVPDYQRTADRADPQDSTWTEGRRARLRGREAGFHREAELIHIADNMTSGFAQNDKVQLGTDESDTGMVEETNPDGSMKVRRDKGGEVTLTAPATQDIKRVAITTPTHAPKGMHSIGPKGDKSVESGDVVEKEEDWLRPELETCARLKWPNVAMLSAALPKLAVAAWFEDVGKAVDRAGGSWEPEMASWELEARFPTQDSARRFAKRLVGEFHVQPGAIEASMAPVSERFMRMGLLRVDMARRVILPGGIVFALEGSVQPGSFHAGDGVIVMDPISQNLAEAVVASVGPDLVVVVASDGTQYEYTRGMLRRLTMARISLKDAPADIFPSGQRVLVGQREGVLMRFEGDDVRVRFSDGPRRVPREAAVALVRVASI